MAPEENDPLLTPAEIAQHFDVDTATVNHWIKTTKLRTAIPQSPDGRATGPLRYAGYSTPKADVDIICDGRGRDYQPGSGQCSIDIDADEVSAQCPDSHEVERRRTA
jgi:hypothetical protein